MRRAGATGGRGRTRIGGDAITHAAFAFEALRQARESTTAFERRVSADPIGVQGEVGFDHGFRPTPHVPLFFLGAACSRS